MPPTAPAPRLDRRADVTALRALAHPIRVRMLMLLRSESLSASDLARRLDIRFGSARFHLHQLVDAGIVHAAGERTERGGTARLFRATEGFRIDVDPETPDLNVALHRSVATELRRRLESAALDQRPGDTEHDVIVLWELALPDRDRAEAEAIIDEALARLRRLHDPDDREAQPHTIGLFSFRTPDERAATEGP
jgi:DNA-binding transcriptional ArsR family regulator